MKKLKKLIFNFVHKLIDNKSLAQGLNVPEGERRITKGMPELVRRAAEEGTVLLKNDGVLPLKRGQKVALFGRCQADYFYVGYGSGGDVHPPYKISPLTALRRADEEGRIVLDEHLLNMYEKWRAVPKNKPDDGWWGFWPMNYPEMPVSEAEVAAAAERSDVAVVIIGRAAVEDRENLLEDGSYYLTDAERSLLKRVSSAFKKTVVVLNCGNIIDLSEICSLGDRLSALVYAWQGGMESGNALADVLTGRVSPSGKLSDTIAARYEDYPSAAHFGGKVYNVYEEDIFVGYRYFETFAKDKVLFPFGFGLSYTEFEISPLDFKTEGGRVQVTASVKNTGSYAGKEVVQLYCSAPCGRLGKPARVLAAFAKTPLLKAGESCTLTLECDLYGISSYDDSGNVQKHAWVLEEGEYAFYIGNSVRAECVAGSFTLEKDVVVKPLQGICGVKSHFHRWVNEGGRLAKERAPHADYDLKERILSRLPGTIGYGGDRGIKLADVKTGRATMERFISQLTNEELEALTRGYGPMNMPLGPAGNAGGYGGVIPSLREKGVPPVITTDGPAGIRLSEFTSLLPCGTQLACTWNTQLVEELYTKVGEEMEELGSDVLLGAGMNIHRNPLCGRNFEYFSEDPFLSGKMGAAFVRGVQKNGRGACPKHFACNNQETKRNTNDSRLSERALREIYLKGFEICVKESRPLNIMVSYNKINGVWAHYNFDLAQTVLREEWGYEGLSITDWWMQKSKSPEFPAICNNAYRVRARVDVLMPGDMSKIAKGYKPDGTLLATLGKEGGITRGEIERAAADTLRIAMHFLK